MSPARKPLPWTRDENLIECFMYAPARPIHADSMQVHPGPRTIFPLHHRSSRLVFCSTRLLESDQMDGHKHHRAWPEKYPPNPTMAFADIFHDGSRDPDGNRGLDQSGKSTRAARLLAHPEAASKSTQLIKFSGKSRSVPVLQVLMPKQHSDMGAVVVCTSRITSDR